MQDLSSIALQQYFLCSRLCYKLLSTHQQIVDLSIIIVVPAKLSSLSSHREPFNNVWQSGTYTSRVLSLYNDILAWRELSCSLNTTVSVNDQVIVRIHEPGKQ
jgi:hypothetical protein